MVCPPAAIKKMYLYSLWLGFILEADDASQWACYRKQPEAKGEVGYNGVTLLCGALDAFHR